MPLPWERDWGLASRVEWQESRGNQNAVSPRGAFGVMQLMPDTAKDPGFGVAPLDPDAPDPEAENRRVGRDYLNAMLQRYGGDKEAALVAYNWGPGNADKWVTSGKNFDSLPRETKGYVTNILGGSDMPMGAMGKPLPWQRKWGGQKAEFPVAAEVGGARQAPGAQASAKVLPVMSNGEVMDDVMRNYISKTMDVGTYLAGLPGDAVKVAQWLDRKMGINSEGSDTPVKFGSDEIREGLKERVGNWDYEPKTSLGQVAGYVPIVGGGGVARGARGAAQIAGGSLLGATGETLGGPIGGAIGAVAGSRVGARAVPTGKAPAITNADRLASEADMVTTPATEAVKRTSQAAYDAAHKAGVQIGGPSFMNFQRSLQSDKVLNSLKLDPQLHPTLAATLKKIEDYVKPTGGAMSAITGRTAPTRMTLEEFDNIRRAALKGARSADADERRLAGHLVDRLDDFFDNTVAKQYPGAAKELQAARRNWKIYRKSERIDRIMEVTRDRAGQFSVSGNENAIRTGFRQLSTEINRNPRTRALFTKDEIRTIRELSRGWRTRDALKNFGAALNNTMVRGIAGGAGGYQYVATDDPTGIILTALGVALGKGARGASGYLAKRKTDQLSDLIRSGGQLTRPNKAQPYLTGYLAAQEGNE